MDIQEILTIHLDRLLASRAYPKTICPSEVARALSASELAAAHLSSWRDAMPEIRRIVADKRARGEVQVLQKGEVVEGELGDALEQVVGPVRVRKILGG